MADITLSPVSQFGQTQVVKFDPRMKTIPLYLVRLISEQTVKPSKSPKNVNFIATKFDDTASYGKFVGFYCSADVEKISKDFQEIITATDKALYIEVMIPWTNILSVQSLIFRQK